MVSRYGCLGNICVQIQDISVCHFACRNGFREHRQNEIMTLIGKLDYPEITAFDYELEHLPELKPEDQEVATEENTDIPEIQEELPEKKGKQNLPPALDVELID